MRGDIRTALGVSMAVSLTVIILLGFFATSSRDIILVFCGFAAGLIAVYLLERFRMTGTRRRSLSH